MADRHIREGERRVSEQALLVEQMAKDGHDTTTAEALLRTLQDTLKTWYEHREQIVLAIERQSGRPSH
jgi:hypothetical protein